MLSALIDGFDLIVLGRTIASVCSRSRSAGCSDELATAAQSCSLPVRCPARTSSCACRNVGGAGLPMTVSATWSSVTSSRPAAAAASRPVRAPSHCSFRASVVLSPPSRRPPVVDGLRSPDDPHVAAVSEPAVAAWCPVMGEAGEAVRSEARGEYGGLIPVRPATSKLVVCLRGHRLDLDLYDKLKPYSHRYRLHGTLCEVCRAQEACEPAARRLTEWAHLDVTVQHPTGTAPGNGLVLVAHPPAAGTLAGRIELRLDGTLVGAVTASLCAGCRTATLDYVHVAAEYRRLGFGRTLVAAAVARAPSYRWTAPLPDGPVAQSFRARMAMRRPGQRCVHAGAVDSPR